MQRQRKLNRVGEPGRIRHANDERVGHLIEGPLLNRAVGDNRHPREQRATMLYEERQRSLPRDDDQVRRPLGVLLPKKVRLSLLMRLACEASDVEKLAVELDPIIRVRCERFVDGVILDDVGGDQPFVRIDDEYPFQFASRRRKAG
jgi:hypothetical protein